MTAFSIVGWDTETVLFGPHNRAPRIVCLTRSDCKGDGRIFVGRADIESQLADLLSRVSGGHNSIYDACCALAHYPEIAHLLLKALQEGRLLDSQIRQTIMDIKDGIYKSNQELDEDPGNVIQLSYGLDAVAFRRLGRKKAADDWKLRYGELENVPLAQWPKLAKFYAIEDAVLHREVLEDQAREALEDPDCLTLEAEMVRSQFALQLVHCWGFMTDASIIEEIRECVLDELNTQDAKYKALGFIRANNKENQGVVRDYVARVYEKAGRQPPLTETKRVSIGKDALYQSGDPALAKYAVVKSYRKILSNDLKMLGKGTVYRIQSSFGIAETLRSTSFDPSQQQTSKVQVTNSKTGKKIRVRDCIVPPEDCVLIEGDFAQLEMCTLGQSLIDLGIDSALPDAINNGKDCHIILACRIHDWEYDWASARKKLDTKKIRDPEERALVELVQLWRQGCKAGNYGFGGGMGVKNFIGFAAKDPYNVTLDFERAKKIREGFIETWNMGPFFKMASDATRYNRRANVQLPRSKNIRGRCGYTQFCNTMFQGPGAVIARESAWLLAKACYFDREDPLYGCHNVMFVHDSNKLEAPKWKAKECAARMSELMLQAGRKWLPDVKPAVDVEIKG